jgi:hypothetical protein
VVMGLRTLSIPESKILNIKKLKSQRFGSWLCFRPQVNGGGEEKNTYSAGSVRQRWVQ